MLRGLLVREEGKGSEGREEGRHRKERTKEVSAENGVWPTHFSCAFASCANISNLDDSQPFRSRANSLRGAKVPRNESSRERMFQGAKRPGNESSRERKGPGAKVPGSELARILLELSLQEAY